MNIREKFKSNLRMLRKEQGLSQVDLANKLQISKSSISSWELGQQEPTMTALCKLADFFKISIDYLVGRED